MALACPECGFELKPDFTASSEYRACHVCGHETSVLPYPSCFAQGQTITQADLRREEDDASCFYHESKKAANACAQCGRFICALCSAQIGEQVLCPACVVSSEKASGEKRPGRLERGRTLYDSLSLIVAVFPALTISFSIVGGPIAVYLALRYWKRPGSVVRRYQWRKWLALGLGLAETGGWIWLFTYMALQRRASA
jgi:hypothetical protein